MRACLVTASILILTAGSITAYAQTPAPAKLVLTVVDPTGAVLPGAVVAVSGKTSAAGAIAPATTDGQGQVRIDRLVPGLYSIHAEFPGFSTVTLKDHRLRSGENKQTVVLPLKGVEDSVTVGRDRHDAATDRTAALGSTLGRAQIESLSDDPDQMRRQLLELAGPDAVIRVDSFEGQPLPAKAQIKLVRIVRDQFAAENHTASSTVEIVTQPGVGPMRGTAQMGFYDNRLDGRNALVAARAAGRNQTFTASVAGTLIRQRADFSLVVGGFESWSVPQLYAATGSGMVARNLGLRSPQSSLSYNGALNYALTPDQTLRVVITGNKSSRQNLGVGQRDLPDRAYRTDSSIFAIRLKETGPLGRQSFTNTKFGLDWVDSRSTSAVSAPTIVVQDAFTAGGAQRAGGTRSATFSLQQDVDYIRGRHSLKAGVVLEGGRFQNDLAINSLGTYFFESLAAYDAGRPQHYTRTLGNPAISYRHFQAGVYVQDEFRPSRRLALNFGLRYEGQLHVDKSLNLAPRLGMTWSPSKSGRTSVRASWGVFYDWFSLTTYAQSLQIDGTRQHEVNVMNPSYPEPGSVSTALPANRYLLAGDLRLPRNMRFSGGVSTSARRANFTALYAYAEGTGLLVGENLNAPVDSVRPDPALANVIRAVARGEFRSHNLTGNVSINLASASAAAGNQRSWSWRRGLTLANYVNVHMTRNNTDGAFAVPASGDVSSEWGPAGPAWSTSAMVNSGMFKNMNLSWSTSVMGPAPFTIRTGRDDNGDLIFNDRPAGLGRNTAVGTVTVNSSASISYTRDLRRAPSTLPANPQSPRYKMTLTLLVENPTNRANYAGYSGVMTSPFFLRPTSITGVRRITVSARIGY